MASTAKASTVDERQVAQFAALAGKWWDERGEFAPLHRINPLRIGYVRDMALKHFGRPIEAGDRTATPLTKLSLLDVGCGGGLLCEPMARLGATVTGIDAAPENTEAAKAHAAGQQLTIDYQATTAEALAATGKQYDIVLALEIIEHVADLDLFYRAIATLVKPGGLIILSTLNRTAKSFALGIIGAEYILRWVPRGTHDWNKFVRPSEMAAALENQGLTIKDTTGIVFDPLSWKFLLNPRDLDVNYLLTAGKNSDIN